MKILIGIFFVFLVSGCGAAGGAGVGGEGQSCGLKSVFSDWADDGGNTLSFSGLAFGTTAGRVTVEGISCDVTVEVTGNECAGSVTYVTSVVTPGQNVLTTVCSDLIGEYDYSRAGVDLVFGRKGSRPEEYH